MWHHFARNQFPVSEFLGGRWIFVHMYILVWGTVLEIFDTKILCRGNFGVGTDTRKCPNSSTFRHIADILPTCRQHSQLRRLRPRSCRWTYGQSPSHHHRFWEETKRRKKGEREQSIFILRPQVTFTQIYLPALDEFNERNTSLRYSLWLSEDQENEDTESEMNN
jgi:hypothetical protein